MGMRRTTGTLLALALIVGGAGRAAAVDPRFALDPKVLDQRPAAAAAPTRPALRQEPAPDATKPATTRSAPKATVKHSRRAVHRSRTAATPHSGGASTAQHLQMLSTTREGEVGALDVVKQFWPDMIPAKESDYKPLEVSGPAYALSLDATRYPTLPAMDGGRVVIDPAGTMPPLVKTLLMEQGEKVRVVSENPANRRRFFSALFKAARFYSVEEDFSVAFGSDPQLTVSADYKVEKAPDSLLRQEVLLMNVRDGLSAMPPALGTFLKGEGFTVQEPFARSSTGGSGGRGVVWQLAAKDAPGMADGLLKALNLPVDRDRNVELFGYRDSGLVLTIKADRYVESGGDRIVINSFTGDPVAYTLTRLLETRGYRVVMLESKDSLQQVSEKLMARLRLPGSYARHTLWAPGDAPYSLRISGVMLPRGTADGRNLFVTSKELQPLHRELLDVNGYRVMAD